MYVKTARTSFRTLVAVAIALGATSVSAVVPGSQSPPASVVASSPAADHPSPENGRTSGNRLPLVFEQNVGQAASEVRFISRGKGMTAFVTHSEIVLAIQTRRDPERSLDPAPLSDVVERGKNGQTTRESAVVHLRIGDSAPGSSVSGSQPLATRINYLRGRDPEGWHTNVPTFGEVRVSSVGPDVDLVLSGDGGIWSHQYALGPNADVESIHVDVTGADRVETSPDGELVLTVGGRAICYGAPQLVTGMGKAPERAEFAMLGDGRIGLRRSTGQATKVSRLPAGVAFSTFFGGDIGSEPAGNDVEAVRSDASGSIYIAGMTNSVDLPGVLGAPQPHLAGPRDIFIAKLSADGTSLLYATYLGGVNEELIGDMAIGPDGSAYVTGSAHSSDFPRTPNALNLGVDNPATDIFVTKILPSGQGLGYSCLIGSEGIDEGTAIAVTNAGEAVVAGGSFLFSGQAAFPTTPGAYDTSENGETDTVVFRINASGTALTWSTFLGGGGLDYPRGLRLGAMDSVYVAGTTASQEIAPYPTTPGAFGVSNAGEEDVFITHLSPSGNSLSYSTLLGGFGEETFSSLDVDSSGNAVVVGSTGSPAPSSFPTTPGAYQTDGGGAFVTKFNLSGTALVYSTLVDNVFNGMPASMALGASGVAYLVGTGGNGPNSPDALLVALSQDGSSINASTFVGGSYIESGVDVDVTNSGSVLIAGTTLSVNFPTTVGCYDAALSSNRAAFVSRRDPVTLAPVSSTLFEGAHATTGTDAANGVAVDANGSAYVVGAVTTVNFPVSSGFDSTLGGQSDATVTKLSPDGSSVVYSTFIGGSDPSLGYDSGIDIAVDSAGAAYVIGNTEAPDFPVTPGAFDTTFEGVNDAAFVLKLSPDGASLEFSTYLGADGGLFSEDSGVGIVVNGDGTPVVCGNTQSDSFPTTSGAYSRVRRGPDDVFVTRFSGDGSALLYSTYLGGDTSDDAFGLALGPDGSAYVTGRTGAIAGEGSFPITPGAVDASFSGFDEGFVTRLSPDGTSLLYSTYLGGSNSDSINAVAVNSLGEAVVAGFSASADYPVFAGFDSTINDLSNGQGDFVVTKLNNLGTALIYSTFLGGENGDGAKDIAIDASGRAVVVGIAGNSIGVEPTFPITENAFQRTSASDYAGSVVSVLSPSGDALVYSTFLGGSLFDDARSVAVDAAGSIYVVGQAASSDFPVVNPLQSQIAGTFDMFITKFVIPATSRDSAGVYVSSSGAWFLRDSNSAGNADIVFTYGPGASGALPLRGDWDGDGLDGPGLYFPSTGAFFLKNASGDGSADLVFTYGAGGVGLKPIVGDWNSDGTDTVGLYATATGAFFLRNSNSAGPADLVFTFGAGGAGVLPLAGDWDGSGSDTVGLYVQATRAFFLRNSNSPGPADRVFVYGPSNALPLVGDWNADGVDTIGVHIPATAAWFLRNTNSPGVADVVFNYGPQGAIAVPGDWNGQ